MHLSVTYCYWGNLINAKPIIQQWPNSNASSGVTNCCWGNFFNAKPIV